MIRMLESRTKSLKKIAKESRANMSLNRVPWISAAKYPPRSPMRIIIPSTLIYPRVFLEIFGKRKSKNRTRQMSRVIRVSGRIRRKSAQEKVSVNSISELSSSKPGDHRGNALDLGQDGSYTALDHADEMGRKEPEKEAKGHHHEKWKSIDHRTAILGMGVLGLELAKEKPSEHPHEIGHREGNSQYGDDGLNRVHPPAPHHNHQLGDEVHGQGKAHRGSQGHHKDPCHKWHLLDKTPQRGNISRVGLVIDPACQGKQHPRGQGMGKHIQDGPRQADHVQCGHAQKDIAHMA